MVELGASLGDFFLAGPLDHQGIIFLGLLMGGHRDLVCRPGGIPFLGGDVFILNKLFGPLHIRFPFLHIGQRLIHLGLRQLDFLRTGAGQELLQPGIGGLHDALGPFHLQVVIRVIDHGQKHTFGNLGSFVHFQVL